jgi:shikimate dehydrogenase
MITRRRVLMIGAGGAARGVLAPLLALEPAELVVANRTADRAEELAQAFADLGNVSGVGFRYISGGAFDLVLNATSASLSGDVPAVAASVMGAETVCYDMAYGKTDTPFVQWALRLGCTNALQGWGMLVEQAAESFRVWRGVRPPTAPVLAALKDRARATLSAS